MLRLLMSRGFLLLLLLVAAWFILRNMLRTGRKGDSSMAKRYGGRYSPDGSQPVPDAASLRPPAPSEGVRPPLARRAGILSLAASPLLIGAFFGDPLHLATNLIAFGSILAAVWMTREGLAAEAAYDARPASRRPAIPRKLFGMALMGAGLGIAAYDPEIGPAPSLVLAAVGMVLHRLAFGGDPMRSKGMAGLEGFQHDRIARITEEGEAYLRAMVEAGQSVRDRALEIRIASFAATARELFRHVADRPSAIAGTRRYLGVYLMGARDATVKFVEQYRNLTDSEDRAAIRRDYEALLTDLEANFTARSQAILAGGREDLEVEVQVLRERLAREGVHMPAADPAADDQDR